MSNIYDVYIASVFCSALLLCIIILIGACIYVRELDKEKGE